MGDLTQIPTFTIPTSPAADNVGLGPELVNPRPTYDYTREADAEVLNYLRQLAAYHQQVMGVKVSGETLPPHDSLRALCSSRRYVFHERFDELAVDPSYWTAGGAAFPSLLNTPRGGAHFALNASNTMTRLLYLWERAQSPKIEFDVVLSGVPSGDALCMFEFVEAGANEAWGVYFQQTGQKIRGFTRTGGADTMTDVNVYVTSVEQHVEFWVDLSNILQVSIDGGTAVPCGVVPTANVTFLMHTSGATVAHMDVRNLLHTADWT